MDSRPRLDAWQVFDPTTDGPRRRSAALQRAVHAASGARTASSAQARDRPSRAAAELGVRLQWWEEPVRLDSTACCRASHRPPLRLICSPMMCPGRRSRTRCSGRCRTRHWPPGC